MTSMIRFALPFVVGAVVTSHALADTFVVSPGGKFPTIQAGVDAAGPDDTVLVKAGTYFEAVVVPVGNDGLVIKGVGKPVLDARGVGGIALGAGIQVGSNNVTVRGLTVRNAKSITNNLGDGIRGTSGNLFVRNCVLLENSEAGVRCTFSTPTVTNCSFKGNITSVSLKDTFSAVIRDCKSDKEDASGVRLENTVDTTIERCSFRMIEDGDVINAGVGTNDNLTVRKCKFENADSAALRVVGANLLFENNKVLIAGGGVVVTGDNAVVRKNSFAKFVDDASALNFATGTNALIEFNVGKDMPDGFLALDPDTANFVIRHNRVVSACCEDEAAYYLDGTGHLIEDNVAIDIGGDAFLIVGDGLALLDCVAKNCLQDGFDIELGTSNTLTNCSARGCLAEGFDNSAIGTIVTGGSAKKCRIDFANDGAVTATGFAFQSGGAAVNPEID
jgi:hypothetical protein